MDPVVTCPSRRAAVVVESPCPGEHAGQLPQVVNVIVRDIEMSFGSSDINKKMPMHLSHVFLIEEPGEIAFEIVGTLTAGDETCLWETKGMNALFLPAAAK